MTTPRFFNTSGPVNGKDHYCIPPISRIDTKKIWQLILQKKYFLIRGPKQSGKTSYLLALAQAINQKGQLKCLYFNIESLRGIQENMEESIKSVLFEIASRARDTFNDEYLEEMVSGILQKRGSFHALNELLTQWSKRSDRPIVLLIDEIDTLKGNVLTSFLSQIRAGYDKRPTFFPQSIVFCGTHDVIEKQFNIKDTTITISYFKRPEMETMLMTYIQKHDLEIEDGVMQKIWDYSNGQPWIISTIAGELFYEMLPYKNMKKIHVTDITEAIINIIEKKGNHLEFLIDQLRDERVQKCMVPMLMGEGIAENLREEDVGFIRELGFLKETNPLEISNCLYKELLPRVLFNPVLYLINLDHTDFTTERGLVDTDKLMKSFQTFFKNHADRLVSLINYGNAGSILIFQALLQKLTEWNMTITRTYAINQNYVVIELHRDYPCEQNMLFFIKHFNVKAPEQNRLTMQSIMDDFAMYIAKRPEVKAEFHLIAINLNINFLWEEKLFSVRKEKQGKIMTLWGF